MLANLLQYSRREPGQSDRPTTPEKIGIGAIAALVAAILLGGSALKPFWYDEVFTLAVSGQRPGPDMWRAITAGFEFNPPLLYVLIYYLEQLVPRGPVLSRLPSIIPCALSVIGIYWVLRFRFHSAVSFLAAGLFLSTSATAYGMELRPYALVVLATVGTWIFWQRARQEEHPRFPLLAAIASCMLIATLSHMWAIAVAGAFLATEVVRLCVTRQRNYAILAAFCLGCTPVLLYPHITAEIQGIVSTSPLYTGGPDALLRAYLILFYWLPVPSLLIAALVARSLLAGPPNSSNEDPAGAGLHLRSFLGDPDLLLSCLLLLSPIGIWCVTWFSGTPFVFRYGLPATLAASFVVSYIADALLRDRRTQWRIAVIVLVAVLVAHSYRALVRNPSRTQGFAERLTALTRIDPDLPLVIENGIVFVDTAILATPHSGPNLVYVADRQKAIEYIHTDGIDGPLLAARPYLPINGDIYTLKEFLAAHSAFYVECGAPESVAAWFCSFLEDSKFQMLPRGGPPNSRTFLVTLR